MLQARHGSYAVLQARHGSYAEDRATSVRLQVLFVYRCFPSGLLRYSLWPTTIRLLCVVSGVAVMGMGSACILPDCSQPASPHKAPLLRLGRVPIVTPLCIDVAITPVASQIQSKNTSGSRSVNTMLVFLQVGAWVSRGRVPCFSQPAGACHGSSRHQCWTRVVRAYSVMYTVTCLYSV